MYRGTSLVALLTRVFLLYNCGNLCVTPLSSNSVPMGTLLHVIYSKYINYFVIKKIFVVNFIISLFTFVKGGHLVHICSSYAPRVQF